MVHQSASTVVGALSARSAVDQESVSTVVSALDARSAVGHKYASMVIGAIDARSVKAHTCNTTSPQSKHPLLPDVLATKRLRHGDVTKHGVGERGEVRLVVD